MLSSTGGCSATSTYVHKSHEITDECAVYLRTSCPAGNDIKIAQQT